METFKPKKILQILGALFCFEVLSYLVYLFPIFNWGVFIILAIAFLIIALADFKLATLILLAELFIGSKGYLFYFSAGGAILSIRIMFWIIIMSVWAAKVIIEWLKTKKFPLASLSKTKFLPALSLLAIFIIFGFINGLIRQNGFGNIFLDFNAWLFFALFFPFYSVFFADIKRAENWENLKEVFFATALWLTLKTLFFLFCFAHNIPGTEQLYLWLRTTGVGEITEIGHGFYRLFFQSHIYLVWAFLFTAVWLAKKFALRDEAKTMLDGDGELTKRGHIVWTVIFGSAFLSVIILSLSRSFWVGLAGGLLLLAIIIWMKTSLRRLMLNLIHWLVMLAGAFIIIFAVAKFPFPPSVGGFDFSLLSQRTDLTSSDAAVNSRWALLSALSQELKESPIFGEGYGATVTYKSSDPRIVQSTTNGLYTTYAFEWGYLDIWLKLGLLGLIAYLGLLYIIFRRALKTSTLKNNWLHLGVAAGILALAITNIFTPYLNHPLGIGYLLLTCLLLSES